MALNSSPVRTDIGFLRRRVKPAAPAAVARDAAATEPEPRRAASAGLSLAPATTGTAASPARPASVATAPATVSPDSLPFPAPTIDEVRELGENEPVLRLNARESAVGSLIVSGADLAVWEDADRVTGSESAAGDTAGTPVTTAGNRPLVGFDEADAIVSLRHLQRLRRALFIARGPHTLGVQIFDGSTVTTARGDDSRMFILCLLRVGNLVELRAEPVDRTASDEAILSQFGFTLTPHVATRESRSR
ncbi:MULTISPECIES: hypothetical protein [Cryobacterium]|uniref:Uncharacterized protein n=1 Tax=Cryobacterium zongtaii TaxID=1259217 RepID=A0A2S3ZCB7_9MICO|nr:MULTISPECIES: hypothetical protein [Cryobacterium]POH63497.1 hypothetical protein C3B60_15320 [Cryobacterium zongtaii]POH63913.1 hypothetical protein C3B61_14090 [Cryobacterium zongtaii]TFC42167.1 hypothetical protein E3O57_16145 [Cryobacterium sp. TMN-39-2]